MDQRRPPPLSLNLASSKSPARPVSTSPVSSHRQSQSPFRYVQFDSDINEKGTSLMDRTRVLPFATPAPSSSSSLSQQHLPSPFPSHPSAFLRTPLPLLVQQRPYSRPRGLRIANLLRPWLPIILYALTTLGFLVAIALYKTEVFALLDELSRWLQADKQYGQAFLFLLIFITTIPPFPLYSTLIILSGYTFGPWTGAIISYSAALTGAVVVFTLSRVLFRDGITRWLAMSISMKRIVRAIEKRPTLLFLIRLAPYPYNVMNCLLAAAPTLTLRTYTLCTGLSLVKVIIHTSLGASIHSFKDYHTITPGSEGEDEDNMGGLWTIGGIGLCIGILVYLSVVARRAVDEEVEESERNEEMVESRHQLVSCV